jgi:hypothetical protein
LTDFENGSDQRLRSAGPRHATGRYTDPGQSGYNERLRTAEFLLKAVIRHLATHTDNV